jgi:hypothetical protein
MLTPTNDNNGGGDGDDDHHHDELFGMKGHYALIFSINVGLNNRFCASDKETVPLLHSKQQGRV